MKLIIDLKEDEQKHIILSLIGVIRRIKEEFEELAKTKKIMIIIRIRILQHNLIRVHRDE